MFLSDIELYYSPELENNNVIIADEEFHHIKDVMRHKVDDIIYITDGNGNIYKCIISRISKNELSAEIKETNSYCNNLSNVTFCLPRLKIADRFEFALEKCVELGITNFIVYESHRAIAKGEKLERWQRILTSAMKQSLRAWVPNVSYCNSVQEITNRIGNKYIFDQNAKKNFISINYTEILDKCYFLFGPEGGFSNEEKSLFSDGNKLKLTENRLRSETAIIVAASMLTSNLAQ